MTTMDTDGRGKPEAQLHSVQDMERLVLQMYQPEPKQAKATLDAAIHQLAELQKSPEGWQLADGLLHSSNSQVRFFGALTFTAKINQDWDSLSNDDAVQLLDRMISWFIQLVNAGETKVVIQKLCSALVAYYLRPSGIWNECVRQLVVSLSQKRLISVDELDQLPTTSAAVLHLDSSSLSAALWFTSHLAVEVNKAGRGSAITDKYYERVSSELNDVVTLMDHAIQLRPGHSLDNFNYGIACFGDWIDFAQRAWTNAGMIPGQIKLLTAKAMLGFTQSETYGDTMDLFADILSTFSAFLTPSDFESLAVLLTSSQTQQVVLRLKNGDYDHATLKFAELLTAYGDVTVQDLAKGTNDPFKGQILYHLFDLLSCAGYPIVEDEVCTQALEFWMTYTEFVTDSLFDLASDAKPPWMTSAMNNIASVVDICCLRIRMPPREVFVAWESDEKAKWKSFRADVRDLIQSSYILLGTQMLNKFVRDALDALRSLSWVSLEARLTCINALSETAANEESAASALSALFSSSLFREISWGADVMPRKLKYTACEVITGYTVFIEAHAEYLPAILTFLFGFLVDDPSATTAARAIEQTCYACRKQLVADLGSFLNQYEALSSRNCTDTYTMQKVIGGISAIVQAIAIDNEKLEPLALLIGSVERDVDACTDAIKTPMTGDEPFEDALRFGTRALSCLESMGKGLQIPDDETIDLDALEHPVDSRYWKQQEGKLLQDRVLRSLKKLSDSMKWNGNVIVGICDVLRIGYKEARPGFFVFQPAITVDFVLGCTLNTPRLDYVLDTASAMLNRQSPGLEPDMQDAATSLLRYLIDLLAMINGNPRMDPELTSSAIGLAAQVIPRFLTQMLRLPNINMIWDFALQSLQSPDIMPKRAAANFWTILVQKHVTSEDDALLLDGMIQHFGPYVCQTLIQLIAGEAPRSELDTLSGPLKKMVFAQPRAKQWLSDALNSKSFPSTKVGPAEKRMWLQKIVNTRGSTVTNKIVKEFWIACRGEEFNYA